MGSLGSQVNTIIKQVPDESVPCLFFFIVHRFQQQNSVVYND